MQDLAIPGRFSRVKEKFYFFVNFLGANASEKPSK